MLRDFNWLFKMYLSGSVRVYLNLGNSITHRNPDSG
jgi:hypothetical protein